MVQCLLVGPGRYVMGGWIHCIVDSGLDVKSQMFRDMMNELTVM